MSNLVEYVMKYNAIFIKWHQTNPNEWRKKMEEDFITQSNGKIRAFQLFFNSPQELASNLFKAVALEEKDVQQMYPNFYQQILSITDKNKYFYIFTCNGVLDNGKTALISNTILSFDN